MLFTGWLISIRYCATDLVGAEVIAGWLYCVFLNNSSACSWHLWIEDSRTWIEDLSFWRSSVWVLAEYKFRWISNWSRIESHFNCSVSAWESMLSFSALSIWNEVFSWVQQLSLLLADKSTIKSRLKTSGRNWKIRCVGKMVLISLWFHYEITYKAELYKKEFYTYLW